MGANITPSEARERLLQLFRDAGYELPELLFYIEELESTRAGQREEISRLKDAAARRATASSTMNSRLKDALRE